jgi:hypothetical protein
MASSGSGLSLSRATGALQILVNGSRPFDRRDRSVRYQYDPVPWMMVCCASMGVSWSTMLAIRCTHPPPPESAVVAQLSCPKIAHRHTHRGSEIALNGALRARLPFQNP